MVFLGSVLIGWGLRYAPWPRSETPRHSILQIDTAACIVVEIRRQGTESFVFERSDRHQWVLTQAERSLVVAPEQIDSMLAALADLSIQQIEHSKRPDTLGLSEGQGLEVVVKTHKGQIEHFRVGNKALLGNQPCRYVMLGKHEGIYTAEGHLNRLFPKDWASYQRRWAFALDTLSLCRLHFETPDSTMWSLKRDSLGNWQQIAPLIEGNKLNVPHLIQVLKRMEQGVPTDYFDETHAFERLVLSTVLSYQNGTGTTLRFYYLNVPDLPDDPRHLPRPQEKIYRYLLQSSDKPTLFLAIDDNLFLSLKSQLNIY